MPKQAEKIDQLVMASRQEAILITKQKEIVEGLLEELAHEHDRLYNTLKKAEIFINDVMPQVGGLCVQDLGNLNECLMEMTEIFKDG